MILSELLANNQESAWESNSVLSTRREDEASDRNRLAGNATLGLRVLSTRRGDEASDRWPGRGGGAYLEAKRIAKTDVDINPSLVSQGIPGLVSGQYTLNYTLVWPMVPVTPSPPDRVIPDQFISDQVIPDWNPRQASFEGVQPELCPGWATFGMCKNDHQFAKQLFCGKEWCKTCGEKWSEAHQRRFARWLPKAEQIKEMGYLVITFSLGARNRLRNKKALSHFRSLVGRYLKRNLFKRGLMRWHWFGDKHPGLYHPHLNILVEGGRLRKKELRETRRYLAELAGVNDLVIDYQYTNKESKMVHFLKYVTRATFLDKSWDPVMAKEIFNFRNQTCFGNWKGEKAWMSKPERELKFEHIADLEKGICPCCGETIKWGSRARPIKELLDLVLEGKAKEIGGGYYYIDVRGKGLKP